MSDKPKLDFGPELADLSELFTDVVTDETDPQFLAFLTDLATDSVELASLKAQGVDDDLIQRAEDAVLARAQSLAGTPSLVAAANAPAFMDIVQRVVATGTAFMASLLRYYLPIAPLPTA